MTDPLTKAGLKMLRLMAAASDPEDAEAVCDGGTVWVGLTTFRKGTLLGLLRLTAVSDVSDGGGCERYVLNGTGRALIADPSQSYYLTLLLMGGKNITIKDDRIIEMGAVAPREELYDADPNCEHDIRAKGLHEGGGIVCRKCGGWFCY